MAKDPNEGWGQFERATEQDIRNIVAASCGEAGSGKTHFWLTAPDPIAYFLFDPGGLKGLMNNPLFKKKEVRVIDFSKKLDWGKIPKDKRTERALEVMEEFDAAWPIALKKARTLVIDKENAYWETLRYAHDEVDSPVPKNFHELNLQYSGMVVQAERDGKNLGLIRDLKDVWGVIGVSQQTGKKQMGFTGEKVPAGQKFVASLVQMNMAHGWDAEERQFVVRILEKCRLGQAKELMGKEFPGMDFAELAVTLYPESELEEWGF